MYPRPLVGAETAKRQHLCKRHAEQRLGLRSMVNPGERSTRFALSTSQRPSQCIWGISAANLAITSLTYTCAPTVKYRVTLALSDAVSALPNSRIEHSFTVSGRQECRLTRSFTGGVKVRVKDVVARFVQQPSTKPGRHIHRPPMPRSAHAAHPRTARHPYHAPSSIFTVEHI
jgi:hypothetical protein